MFFFAHQETQRALGLSRSDVVQLGCNGIEATFLTEEKKKQLRLELDTYVNSFPASGLHE